MESIIELTIYVFDGQILDLDVSKLDLDMYDFEICDIGMILSVNDNEENRVLKSFLVLVSIIELPLYTMRVQSGNSIFNPFRAIKWHYKEGKLPTL